MCYKPLHIKNKKLDFDMYRDSALLGVPCGTCFECRNAIRMAWYTRAYYEYLDCQSKNGRVFYVTLTFAPKFLPTYNGVSCFDKRKVQLFLKRLRKNLNIEGIKYFICSEYGGVTHRPHHHGLIYVPNCQHLTIHDICEEIRRCWFYGFVSYGSRGAICQNAAAVNYVCKYICKDMSFDYDAVPKKYAPFHLQSKGFGQYIIDKYCLYDLSSIDTFNAFKKGFVKVELDSGYSYVMIPQYITRKILYDVEYYEENGQKKPRWILNDFGKSVKKSRFDIEVKESVQRFDTLFNSIENILYDSKRLEMFNRSANSNFATAIAVRFQLQKVDFEELAMYCSLYKDRVVITSLDNDSFLDASPLPLFSYPSIEYALDVKFGFREPDYDTSKNLSQQAYKVSPDFEYAISIYNALLYVQGYYAQKEFDKKERESAQRKKLEKLRIK